MNEGGAQLLEPFEDFLREQLSELARRIAAEHERRSRPPSVGVALAASEEEEGAERGAETSQQRPALGGPYGASEGEVNSESGEVADVELKKTIGDACSEGAAEAAEAPCGPCAEREEPDAGGGGEQPQRSAEESSHVSEDSSPSEACPPSDAGCRAALPFGMCHSIETEATTAACMESGNPAGFALALPQRVAKEPETAPACADADHPLAVPVPESPCAETRDTSPTRTRPQRSGTHFLEQPHEQRRERRSNTKTSQMTTHSGKSAKSRTGGLRSASKNEADGASFGQVLPASPSRTLNFICEQESADVVRPPSSPGGRTEIDLENRSVLTCKSVLTKQSSKFSKGSILGSQQVPAISEQAVDTLRFHLIPLWLEAAPPTIEKVTSLRTLRGSLRGSLRAGTTRSLEARVSWLPVVSPNSVKRFLWDVLSIVCIVHDAVMAPLEFLEVPKILFTEVFSWSARIFWTLDMIVSFCTGIQNSDGTIEFRPARIAKRYLTSWFLPDLVIVTADWMEVILDGMGKASQLIGLLRLLRLVRLLRFQRIVSVAAEKAKSETVALLLGMINCTGAIVGVAHAMASIWLGLGRMSSSHWVAVNGLGKDQHLEQYIMALQWSLTNFAGASDLNVTTTTERCFAIGALLVGFLIASWFVSNVTSSMTRLSIIASKNAIAFAVLNKYMKEHGISGGLARRVHLNAKHAIAEKEERMQESDVELLNIVSEPLRAEVHYEIFSPALLCHPLFHRLKSASLRAMQQMCHTGVSVMPLEDGDIVFTRGEVPELPRMLFVLTGNLDYTQDGENVVSVTANQWVSEQVLWTHWVYHGNLLATNSCRILALEAPCFWRACGPSQLAGFDLTPYANKFMQWQNSGPEARSDVGNPNESWRILQEAYNERVRRASQASMGSWLPQRRHSIATC